MDLRGSTACNRCTGVTMGSARKVHSRQLAKESGRCRQVVSPCAQSIVFLSLPSRGIYSPFRQAPCCLLALTDHGTHTTLCRSLSPLFGMSFVATGRGWMFTGRDARSVRGRRYAGGRGKKKEKKRTCRARPCSPSKKKAVEKQLKRHRP